jgi:hypothetical protein
MKPMAKSRKAQIKMFETIAVLVVFFFILVFGVTFYFVLQRSSLNRQMERNAQLVSVQISQKISDLPELDCVLAGIQIDNCVDKVKLEKLNQALEDDAVKLYYFNVLGYSEVAIKTVYTAFNLEDEYMIYERTPDSFYSAYKNQIPVLLYDPVENKFAFSALEVTTYVI